MNKSTELGMSQYLLLDENGLTANKGVMGESESYCYSSSTVGGERAIIGVRRGIFVSTNKKIENYLSGVLVEQAWDGSYIFKTLDGKKMLDYEGYTIGNFIKKYLRLIKKVEKNKQKTNQVLEDA